MTIKHGEYAEGYPWQVIKNYTSDYCSKKSICPHVTAKQQKEDSGYYEVKIPRAVVAHNEGGYNCTIVCLDCILEASERL